MKELKGQNAHSTRAATGRKPPPPAASKMLHKQDATGTGTPFQLLTTLIPAHTSAVVLVYVYWTANQPAGPSSKPC